MMNQQMMNQHKYPDDGRLADGRAMDALTERGFQALHSERTEMNCLGDRRERSGQPAIVLAGTLVERYRIIHQQGFIPIFVSDRLDAVQLAEAAVAAGAKAIEITCRRAAVCDDIRRVRSAIPELLVLAGSVIDDGPIAEFLRAQRPRIPTLNQLCDLGVDGFVSALPLSLESIARFSTTHLLIPGVETVTEAVRIVFVVCTVWSNFSECF